MNIERVLQVHIAVMVGMGAVMIGISQRSPALPALVIFAAVSSVCFTDWLKWFSLNRILANAAAVLALIFSFGDYFDGAGGSQDQLMAIANQQHDFSYGAFWAGSNVAQIRELEAADLVNQLVLEIKSN